MSNSLFYHKLRILYCCVTICLVSIFIEQSESFFFSSTRGRIQGPSFFRRSQFRNRNIGPILDHRSLPRYHHVSETLPARNPTQKPKLKFQNRKRSLTLPYNVTTIKTSQKQNTIKEASCIVSTAFVQKLEKLLSSGKTSEKLHKLWIHWKNKSKHCKIQGRASRAMENSKEPETGYYHDKNLKSIVTITGLGSLLTTGALLWLSLAEKSKKLKKLKSNAKSKSKKRITQHLHLHPILGALTKEAEKEVESKEEKSEESGKKRAAVKIGLATEILAINAESIHLTAHIIEFLFIMTKLARALATLGMPAPAPLEGNQLLTPAQAQELIQMIEKESSTNTNSVFGAGELKNPLNVIGKNITASAIFQGALKNPTSLGIQNLFSVIKGTGKLV